MCSGKLNCKSYVTGYNGFVIGSRLANDTLPEYSIGCRWISISTFPWRKEISSSCADARRQCYNISSTSKFDHYSHLLFQSFLFLLINNKKMQYIQLFNSSFSVTRWYFLIMRLIDFFHSLFQVQKYIGCWLRLRTYYWTHPFLWSLWKSIIKMVILSSA